MIPEKTNLWQWDFYAKYFFFLSYGVRELKNLTLKNFLNLSLSFLGFSNFSWLSCALLKSMRGVVSSTLPGCILGSASLVVFRHVVHTVKQIHIPCIRKTCQWWHISARTQWPGKNVTIWHALWRASKSAYFLQILDCTT